MSIHKATQPYVLLVGGANVDITGIPSQDLRQRDSNPGNIDLSCGGVARNVAENLARLGVDARLVTMVGNDQYGEMILALSRTAGIDMQYTQTSDTATTSSYLSILDETGDMHVAIADMSIVERITPEWLAGYQHAFEEAAAIVIDANLPEASIEWIGRQFSDVHIFADAVSASKAPRLQSALASIDTLKLNALEAAALANIEGDANAIADELHAQGVDRIFITRGVEGVFYSTVEERADVEPARTIKPAHNSGGAGDAFLAGLIYARLEDWPMEQTVRFAMAAAEVTAAARATSNRALSLNTINKLMESTDA